MWVGFSPKKIRYSPKNLKQVHTALPSITFNLEKKNARYLTSLNVIPRAFGTCPCGYIECICSDFFAKRMNKKSKIKKLMIPPTSLMPLPPWINPAQYRWMENGIVSKVSLRTSQTRKYNGIYVRIKVWGILGSIKCIQRVLVSTPLTSNAPSVAS